MLFYWERVTLDDSDRLTELEVDWLALNDSLALTDSKVLKLSERLALNDSD